MEDLVQKAITAATSGKWQEAANYNLEILKKYPENLDALNRLAKAYAEIGKIQKAISTAKKALKINPFDPIAKKNLEKWKKLKSDQISPSTQSNIENFIEEPGKTKIVSLVYTTDPKTIASLDTGDEVYFAIKGGCLQVVTKDGKYIGKLTDDISSRLKKLIKLGNKYQVFIKSIDSKKVKVFIREILRSKKAEKIPSFVSEKIDYIPFTPPELVHNKEDLEITNEYEGEE